ncbi:unnamed protein product, partial [Iphiclides podalirius]
MQCVCDSMSFVDRKTRTAIPYVLGDLFRSRAISAAYRVLGGLGAVVEPGEGFRAETCGLCFPLRAALGVTPVYLVVTARHKRKCLSSPSARLGCTAPPSRLGKARGAYPAVGARKRPRRHVPASPLTQIDFWSSFGVRRCNVGFDTSLGRLFPPHFGLRYRHNIGPPSSIDGGRTLVRMQISARTQALMNDALTPQKARVYEENT